MSFRTRHMVHGEVTITPGALDVEDAASVMHPILVNIRRRGATMIDPTFNEIIDKAEFLDIPKIFLENSIFKQDFPKIIQHQGSSDLIFIYALTLEPDGIIMHFKNGLQSEMRVAVKNFTGTIIADVPTSYPVKRRRGRRPKADSPRAKMRNIETTTFEFVCNIGGEVPSLMIARTRGADTSSCELIAGLGCNYMVYQHREF